SARISYSYLHLPVVAFTPDSQHLVGLEHTLLHEDESRRDIRRVYRVDPSTGQEVTPPLLSEVAQDSRALAFSRDGRSLATTSSDFTQIHVYDLATGKEQRLAGEADNAVSRTEGENTIGTVRRHQFSPDLTTLALLRRTGLWPMQTWTVTLR